MSADYERKLHGAVAQFVKEADKKYPNWSERNDNGEWEIGLDKFDDMYKVILEIIEYTSCDEATEQMLDDILFGIARDNECSRIIEVLLKYPDWYALLCEKVLFTEYINAKWQFAESLKDYHGKDEIKDLIFDFLQVDDEYTQRMALKSFGGSGKTPNIKVIFCHKPTEEVEFILNKIKETVTNNGYTFEWIYRPVP